MNTSSFLSKLSLVLFILAIASGTAGFCAWKYWNVIFDSLGYATADFVKLNAEKQAMKTPLNLTMYAMPVSFGCAAAGFFIASGVVALMDIAGDVKACFAVGFSRMRNKDDNHA
ncbi:hypothetical protein NG99_22500 [Erwinia typographi]|uniref:Uncharacterized protein n=1 Tax=Erwinia typographi TaxID=371042 RepID=A0A0A3YMB6_9GAMM|nr:hypothetical protein [Erwinia typographi]KGT87932.1 hypothetical protein NG99_22500 [Erwinia typographi]